MRPKQITNHQENLFKNRLSNQLNPRNELFRLAKIIPWEVLEKECGDLFKNQTQGRPAISVRLMIGVLLLQNMHNLSD